MRRAALALLLLSAPAPGAAALGPAYGGVLRLSLPAPPRLTAPALAAAPADVAAARASAAPPLRLRPDGRLEPTLLAAPPVAEEGGRAWRLALRPGIRFADGTPITAADLAAALARVLRPASGSPHAWLAVAIAGADDVLEGRAEAPAGIALLSDHELRITLEFPLPEFPYALAALPASPVAPSGAGAGPFRPEGTRLVANDLCARGRPFADGLVLEGPEALAPGRADLALRAAPGTGAVLLPLAEATYAAIGARPGARSEALRRFLASVDRTELVRRFVRAPAEPLGALLPAPLLPGAAPPLRAAFAGTLPGHVAILIPAGARDPRAIAERLQVMLYDLGATATIEAAGPRRLAARLAARDFDLAIVPVLLLAARPALAAGQVAGAFGGWRAARAAERRLAGLDGEAALAVAAALAAELDVVPLYASGLRALAAPALRGLAPAPDGAVDPGDLWLGPAGPP